MHALSNAHIANTPGEAGDVTIPARLVSRACEKRRYKARCSSGRGPGRALERATGAPVLPRHVFVTHGEYQEM